MIEALERPLSGREAARLRQQRSRERKQKAGELRAIAEAEHAEREAARREIIDEQLAPAILRAPIYARGGSMLVGPRVQIVDGKPVRALALGTPDEPFKAMALTTRQRQTANQLLADWRDVGQGLGVGAADYLRSGAGSGMGGHDAMLAQIGTRARLDGAMAHLGAFAPGVSRVVLDCIPVCVWADEVGKSFEAARAWIVAALNRLATFYWPPGPTFAQKPEILSFGPSRDTYDTSISENDA